MNKNINIFGINFGKIINEESSEIIRDFKLKIEEIIMHQNESGEISNASVKILVNKKDVEEKIKIVKDYINEYGFFQVPYSKEYTFENNHNLLNINKFEDFILINIWNKEFYELEIFNKVKFDCLIDSINLFDFEINYNEEYITKIYSNLDFYSKTGYEKEIHYTNIIKDSEENILKVEFITNVNMEKQNALSKYLKGKGFKENKIDHNKTCFYLMKKVPILVTIENKGMCRISIEYILFNKLDNFLNFTEEGRYFHIFNFTIGEEIFEQDFYPKERIVEIRGDNIELSFDLKKEEKVVLEEIDVKFKIDYNKEQIKDLLLSKIKSFGFTERNIDFQNISYIKYNIKITIKITQKYIQMNISKTK